jgi:hypothetical protein
MQEDSFPGGLRASTHNMDGKRANSVSKDKMKLATAGQARTIRHPGFVARWRIVLFWTVRLPGPRRFVNRVREQLVNSRNARPLLQIGLAITKRFLDEGA